MSSSRKRKGAPEPDGPPQLNNHSAPASSSAAGDNTINAKPELHPQDSSPFDPNNNSEHGPLPPSSGNDNNATFDRAEQTTPFKTPTRRGGKNISGHSPLTSIRPNYTPTNGVHTSLEDPFATSRRPSTIKATPATPYGKRARHVSGLTYCKGIPMAMQSNIPAVTPAHLAIPGQVAGTVVSTRPATAQPTAGPSGYAGATSYVAANSGTNSTSTLHQTSTFPGTSTSVAALLAAGAASSSSMAPSSPFPQGGPFRRTLASHAALPLVLVNRSPRPPMPGPVYQMTDRQAFGIQMPTAAAPPGPAMMTWNHTVTQTAMHAPPPADVATDLYHPPLCGRSSASSISHANPEPNAAAAPPARPQPIPTASPVVNLTTAHHQELLPMFPMGHINQLQAIEQQILIRERSLAVRQEELLERERFLALQQEAFSQQQEQEIARLWRVMAHRTANAPGGNTVTPQLSSIPADQYHPSAPFINSAAPFGAAPHQGPDFGRFPQALDEAFGAEIHENDDNQSHSPAEIDQSMAVDPCNAPENVPLDRHYVSFTPRNRLTMTWGPTCPNGNPCAFSAVNIGPGARLTCLTCGCTITITGSTRMAIMGNIPIDNNI